MAKLKNPSIKLNSGPSNRVIYLHMDQFRENSPHIKQLVVERLKTL